MDELRYATGYVRALETKLLSEAQLGRIAAAMDFESAFALLSESVYATLVPKLVHPFDFEGLLEMERQNTRLLLDRLAPSNPLLDILFKHDGKIELDGSYFRQLAKVAAKSRVPLFKELAASRIDLNNLKTLLRINLFHKDKKMLEKNIFPGGLVGVDVWLSLFLKNPQEIASRLDYTPYFPDLAEGLEVFSREQNFYLLERSIDDHILNRIKKAKYLSFGIEPLLGFYLAKENEARTLRFIFVCKKNRIANEEIKKRLRTSYV